MRLLSLDYEPVFGDAEFLPFSSDASVFDYDAVIWDPQESFWLYTDYSSSYQGLPSLGESNSVRITADASRRRNEFLEFLNSGRSLVALVRPPQRCFVDTGKRTYSGTGRNRVTTTHVEEFDLWSALPVNKVHFERAKGSRIEIESSDPVANLLKRYKDFISYSAVMKDAPGSVIARVNGTERIVSSAIRTKNGGWLVLLPFLDFDAKDSKKNEDEDDWPDEAVQFQADLISALLELNSGSVTARPAWSESYATEAQQDLKDKVRAQQERVEGARARLTKLQAQKEEAEGRDQLYLGTGPALEFQVREVFELLGGKVSQPEPGRDDWRVEFPEGSAVLEVKGVGKSAAEKHAAQLEKWVAGAFEETGAMPKGILVVNTWRELPLDERDKDDFPAQMLPYSKGRNHCLVTGLQLFLIRADVEADSARAVHWRETLMKTKGELKKPSNWRSVIHLTETEQAP